MQSVRLKILRETDLIGPLRAYIHQHFSANESPDLDHALADIQMMRNQIVGYINASELDYERALHAHEEYLSALVGLMSRFPFGEFEAPKLFRKKDVSAVMVQWYATDAFKPGKFAVAYNVMLEKCAICFNIGAIHSRQALSFDRDTPNGIQSACKSLQRAAGIFQLMAATMSANFANNVDLSSSALSFLSNLMLAQAAALSFDSAVRKSMAPGVLAVLACGVSEAFSQARTSLRSDPNLLKWLSKSDFIDEKFLTYQIGCFESASHFWQSEKDQADSQYGVVIARLRRSQDILRSIVSNEPAIESCRSSRKKLDDIVTSKLKSAVYDNDTIYHYPIPSVEELSNISPKTVVKPTAYSLPLGKLGKAFDGLVSVEIQKAIQRFKSELLEEVASLTNTCLDSTDICRSALSEMNLPAALDALDSEARIPKDTVDKLTAIRNAGGLHSLQNLREEIQEMATNSWALRNEISQLLSQEQTNEEKFRNEYKLSWERTPSSDINAPYLRDLKTVTKYLEQARDADSKVFTLFSNSLELLAYVSRPNDEIESSLPVLDKSAKSGASEKVRSILYELSSLLRKRDRLIDEFERAVEMFDPTPAVLANKDSSTVDDILQSQKAQFEVHRKAIDENLANQQSLFDSLVEANQQFLNSHNVSEVEEKRQKCLQKINQGTTIFEKVHRSFAEGLSFYTDLLNDYLRPLKDNVLGFVTARDHEARLLLDEISRRFGEVSLSDKANPNRRLHRDVAGGDNVHNPSAPPRF